MNIIVYADFNCPCCYLASLRADSLALAGAAGVDWRAVEHDRSLPLTGVRTDAGETSWHRRLAEARTLARPGEQVSGALPLLISNTRAAVSAYAEAVSDGIAGDLRRRLFRAIWIQGLHLSDAYDVRAVVRELVWPGGDALARLQSPSMPAPLGHDPDLAHVVRRSGGVITPDGGPLTTVGFRRIRRWRAEWAALPQQVVPAVIDADGDWHGGADGLRYLASVAGMARPRRGRAA